MKIPTFFLTVFCACWNLVLWAQDPLITATPSQGCDSLKVNFSFTTSLSSVTSYIWKFGDGTSDNTPSPVKTYLKPGKYNVSLNLNNTDSSTTVVYVGRTPSRDSLNLAINHRDTSVSGPNNYVIDVSYNNKHPFPYSYQWYIEGVAESTNRSFVHQFNSVGLYHVRLKMTDSIGCTNIFNDSIVISAGIYVPNVFSPNGDTHNDVFYINYNGLDIISFKVFTRTGILIYKTEAKTIAWDGRLPSGDKVLPGIYFYVVETVNTTTPVKKSGFFYIFQ